MNIINVAGAQILECYSAVFQVYSPINVREPSNCFYSTAMQMISNRKENEKQKHGAICHG